jgi:carboxyl-terminal processing protease
MRKNMNRKIIILLQIAALFFCTNLALAETKEPNKEKHPHGYYYKQFQEVFQRIERDYMQEPDRQEMTDEAINGMLQSLDPYSSYFTDEDLEFFLDNTDGEFGGIGVEIIFDRGAVKVISPIDDLPAHKAGIAAGDYIIGVNGKLVSNMGFNKAVREMRGKPGTKLNLLVAKEDENQPREIELKREIVKIKPIKYEIEKDEFGTIGYVRIVAFNNKTVSELKNAIKTIEEKSKQENSALKGIILDVRNNPGGLLDQAVAVGEYFIDHGTIVSTRGRKKENDIILSASRFTAKAPDVPMVVLINSGTASASEIVAGALQDHKRAIILGTTSFGKGLVQTFTQISSRAAVKLTTAKYYTPSGKSINAKGIEPDVFIENAKVEYAKNNDEDKTFTSSSVKDYLKKYNVDEKIDNKEQLDKKNEHKMSDKYKDDYQYARAYDLIRGLIISQNKK